MSSLSSEARLWEGKHIKRKPSLQVQDWSCTDSGNLGLFFKHPSGMSSCQNGEKSIKVAIFCSASQQSPVLHPSEQRSVWAPVSLTPPPSALIGQPARDTKKIRAAPMHNGDKNEGREIHPSSEKHKGIQVWMTRGVTEWCHSVTIDGALQGQCFLREKGDIFKHTEGQNMASLKDFVSVLQKLEIWFKGWMIENWWLWNVCHGWSHSHVC